MIPAGTRVVRPEQTFQRWQQTALTGGESDSWSLMQISAYFPSPIAHSSTISLKQACLNFPSTLGWITSILNSKFVKGHSARGGGGQSLRWSGIWVWFCTFGLFCPWNWEAYQQLLEAPVIAQGKKNAINLSRIAAGNRRGKKFW